MNRGRLNVRVIDDSSSSSSEDSSQEDIDLETVSVNSQSSSSSSSSSSMNPPRLLPRIMLESSSSSSSGDWSRRRRLRRPRPPARNVINTQVIPSTLNRARNELALIFDRTNWHYPEAHNFVLSVIQQYPELASETFEDSYDEVRYPLSHLLVARASLDVIQAVYNLYPDVISKKQGSRGDYCAHDACWYGNNTEVVKFIVTEFPEALTMKNQFDRLPMHDALRSSQVSRSGKWTELTPLKTLQFLLEMYPQWIPDNDGKNYLESAFSYGYKVDTLNCFADHWPSHLDSFQFQSTRAVAFDEEKISILTKILPQLKSLRLDSPTWTLKGFVSLMQYLEEQNGANHFLQMLEILEFPVELLAQEELAQAALRQCLSQNTTLNILILSFPPVTNLLENECDVALRVMGEALQHNSSLKRLVLKRMLLSNGNQLTNVFLNSRAPTSVVLEQVAFQQQQPITNNTPPPSLKKSQEDLDDGGIESVCFIDCIIPPASFADLLNRVVEMPSLKQLTIGIGPSVPGASALESTDLTEPLVSLLKYGRVEEMCISALFTVRMEPICELLTTNTSLRTLQILAVNEQQSSLVMLEEVLANHNTTLTDCGVKPRGRHDRIRDKVILWTRLNRFGRGKARMDGTTKRELLGGLCAFQQDESALKLPIDRFNVWYGLLRECPHLWCGQEEAEKHT